MNQSNQAREWLRAMNLGHPQKMHEIAHPDSF